MHLLYILAMLRKDASIADIGWGLGFVLISVNLMRELGDAQGAHFKIVSILVIVWGGRLAMHILSRKAGKPEDWRYARWREQWGKNYWWRSYVQVFVLQGILMLGIATPLYLSAAADSEIATGVVTIGVVVWTVGYFFEVVGDWQLTQFLKRRARKAAVEGKKHKPAKSKKQAASVMQTGLWRYTRHPNYFGEITQWWGLFIVVIGLENGWIGIISPLLITFLLLKVSGITLLEARFAGDKNFEAYKRRTSALIPLPPRR